MKDVSYYYIAVNCAARIEYNYLWQKSEMKVDITQMSMSYDGVGEMSFICQEDSTEPSSMSPSATEQSFEKCPMLYIKD
jgi:hypothetical protein